jgi:lipoprotein-anchoring transpeptidase ErfK/SrfK
MRIFMVSFSSSVVLRSFVTLFGCVFLGCSQAGIEKQQTSLWKTSGSFTIARAAPSVSQGSEHGVLMGFMPSELNSSTPKGKWIRVDRASNSLVLMDGTSSVTSAQVDGIDRMHSGKYQVIHKQKDPMWYAPDSYFANRHLEVPGKMDRERFRRGALGSYVVYFDKQTPLHSSPIPCDEVGGVRMDEKNMVEFYSQLPVGAEIEVREQAAS